MEQTLEIRSVEIRSANLDERTITGLAVPYNQVTSVGGYKERFEKGAFGDATDVLLFSKHQEEIGLVTKGEDTDEGYVITARISETPEGNRVYTLLKDGVLKRFSVGFLPVEHRMEEDVVVRTKAALKEVSVVAFPAYEGAVISEVREKNSAVRDDSENKENKGDIIMSNDNYAQESDVADVRNAVEDLERRLAVYGESKNEGSAPLFRSGGELLKALSNGSTEARDFATTVDADVQPAWVSPDLRLKVENRNVINLFNKQALPASGMSVEYKKVAGTSGTVGVQAAEGDALNYLEVTLEDATADVDTYGGYISLSRQAIERAEVPYLNTEIAHMVNQYAKATNDAVRAALVAGTGYGTGTLAADDGEAWIDIIVDAADYIDANGRGARADFVLVSSNVFKRLAHMTDTAGRPLFGISGQAVNSLGATNLVAGTLNIGGLTVVRDSGLAANSTFVASSDAVTVWESPGAPFRLEDENIINLTKDFSLYGYLAVGVTNENAVVKVDVDLVA